VDNHGCVLLIFSISSQLTKSNEAKLIASRWQSCWEQCCAVLSIFHSARPQSLELAGKT